MAHSGWHVGLVASALILSVSLYLNLPIPGMLLLASSAGAFLVYVCDRAWSHSVEDSSNVPDRVAWWQRSPGRNGAIMAGLGIVSVWAGLHVSGPVLTTGIMCGAIGVWYGLPEDWVGRWSLKRIAGRGRAPLVATVWGVGVVALVAVSDPTPGWAPLVLLAAYRTFWLLPDVLASEYADRAGDALSGLDSLTAGWTMTKLRRVSWLGLLPVGALAVLLSVAPGGGQPTWLMLDAVGMIVSCVVLQRSSEVDGGTVFVLDLLAAWPIVPALLL